MSSVCKCGHPYSEHTRLSGPNSTNMWSFKECAHGWESHTGYLLRGSYWCGCNKYQFSLFKTVQHALLKRKEA